MTPEFEASTKVPLKVVDLSVLPDIEERAAALAAAQELFTPAYREFSDEEKFPDTYDSFEDYLGQPNRYFHVALDKDGQAQGLAIGAIFPVSKTATLTYLVTNDTAAEKVLAEAMAKTADLHFLDAFIAELPDGDRLTAQEIKKRRFFANYLGGQRVPITGYEQPLSENTGEAAQVAGLHPYLATTKPGKTDREKSMLAGEHLEQLARLYDDDLDVWKNIENLDRYDLEMARAKWTPAPADGLKNTP